MKEMNTTLGKYSLSELLEKKRTKKLRSKNDLMNALQTPVNIESKDSDVLLIVDIQKAYSKNISSSYIKNVSEFLNRTKFREVRLMFDIFHKTAFGDMIPHCIGKHATHSPIMKQYSEGLPHYQISNSASLKDNQMNDSGNKKELYEELENNKVLPLANGGTVFHLPSRSGCNFMEYCFKDFIEILNSWKEGNKKVYLIGGGKDRCVLVTMKILNAMGIENERLDSLCYDIHSSNEYDPDDISCISEEEYDLMDISNGKLRWMFVKNDNKDLYDYLKVK